jgi:hypothetical protein
MDSFTFFFLDLELCEMNNIKYFVFFFMRLCLDRIGFKPSKNLCYQATAVWLNSHRVQNIPEELLGGLSVACIEGASIVDTVRLF